MRLPAALALALLVAAPAAAELRGHGGPVRALAIAADGTTAVTGSFDERAIVWSLEDERAARVLRFHDGSVNAVALLAGDRIATAGADGRIALWDRGPSPQTVLTGHTAPIAALAVSPDGTLLASAAWDRTARLWPLAGGAPRVLEGHEGNVNGIGFTPDGAAAVTVGYDGTLRIWPLAGAGPPRVVTSTTPLNALVVAGSGTLIAAGADGRLRLLGPAATTFREVSVADAPLTTLALTADGALIAAAGIRGAVAVLDGTSLAPIATLVGPGLPIWSMAFTPDGVQLLTGGSDGIVRRWDPRTGTPLDDLLAATDPRPVDGADREGARVFRACAACHALGPGGPERAGPTLHGLFGRKIGSVDGYPYSAALPALDIVWTPETVAALFREGPSRYTPGTRMPEQRIADEAELAALVRFLERATR